MLRIKHWVLIISLLAVQSNFCMQPDFAKKVHLDDGHEWTQIKEKEDGESFVEKVVAYRSNHESLQGEWAYQISPEDETCYGIFDLVQAPDGEKYILYIHGNAAVIPSTYATLVYMRHLTLAEARHWDCMIQSGDLMLPRCFAHEGEGISLDSLISSEQKKYFRNQVHKTFWPTHRLLWLGHKDSGSPLRILPKDIIRLLARQVFEAEVDELQQKSKPDDLLILE